MVVVAPRPGMAVLVEGNCEVGPGGNCHETHARNHPYTHRSRAVLDAAVAQFAITVVAPGPGLAVLVQSHGVSARGDARELDARRHDDRNGNRRVGGTSIAELSLAVVAPCPGMAVRVESKAVPVAGCDRLKGDSGGHLNRSRFGPGSSRVVSKLTRVVESPRPSLTFAVQTHHVICATGKSRESDPGRQVHVHRGRERSPGPQVPRGWCLLGRARGADVATGGEGPDHEGDQPECGSALSGSSHAVTSCVNRSHRTANEFAGVD